MRQATHTAANNTTDRTPAGAQGAQAGSTVASGQRLLVVVAALLGANIVVQLVSMSGPAAAVAQPKGTEGATGFITTAEMVNRTNQLLMDVNGRLSKIESALSGPLEVKIVSSVPLKVDGAAGATAPSAPAVAPADAPAADGAATPAPPAPARPTIRINQSGGK